MLRMTDDGAGTNERRNRHGAAGIHSWEAGCPARTDWPPRLRPGLFTNSHACMGDQGVREASRAPERSVTAMAHPRPISLGRRESVGTRRSTVDRRLSQVASASLLRVAECCRQCLPGHHQSASAGSPDRAARRVILIPMIQGTAADFLK